MNLSISRNYEILYNNFKGCSIVEQSLDIVYTESHEKLVFD